MADAILSKHDLRKKALSYQCQLPDTLGPGDIALLICLRYPFEKIPRPNDPLCRALESFFIDNIDAGGNEIDRRVDRFTTEDTYSTFVHSSYTYFVFADHGKLRAQVEYRDSKDREYYKTGLYSECIATKPERIIGYLSAEACDALRLFDRYEYDRYPDPYFCGCDRFVLVHADVRNHAGYGKHHLITRIDFQGFLPNVQAWHKEFCGQPLPDNCLLWRWVDRPVGIVPAEQAEAVSGESLPQGQDTGGNSETTKPGKREQQIAVIVEIATELYSDPLSIPYGGKKAIKRKCLDKHNEHSNLFTDDGFDHAWKEGINSTPPKFRMKNHDVYAPRRR